MAEIKRLLMENEDLKAENEALRADKAQWLKDDEAWMCRVRDLEVAIERMIEQVGAMTVKAKRVQGWQNNPAICPLYRKP